MRRVLMTAAAATALGIAAPAMASVTVTSTDPNSTSGKPDSYQIYGIANGSAGTGHQVFGSSPDNTKSPNVTFTSGINSNVQISVDNGAAQITPSSGSWTQLIINPDLPFTDFKFAVSLTGGTGTGNVILYYLTDPNANGDLASSYTSTCLTCTLTPSGSNINFDLTGDTFYGFMLQLDSTAIANGVTFGTVKQMSYEPLSTAVPEPATWGLMLLGFGGIGMAMRRRRKENGALMQVA